MKKQILTAKVKVDLKALDGLDVTGIRELFEEIADRYIKSADYTSIDPPVRFCTIVGKGDIVQGLLEVYRLETDAEEMERLDQER